MKLAVMSDIHGNYIALQRCIDYALAQQAEAFIFLGDYHGELAYPQKTMSILYALRDKYPCYFVRGNKEDYWASYRRNGETGWRYNDSTTGSLLYIYERLTNADFDFFHSMPLVQTITFESLPAITICHGSPRKTKEKMLPENKNTFSIMEQNANRIILCGHTHIQAKIIHKGKIVLNPGSVGVPIESGGKTQFMLMTGIDGKWQYQFVSLDYDIETVISDLHTVGLDSYAPSWCKVTEYLLRGGDISHGQVLKRAMQLCTKKHGECIWPNIPESCWEEAVKQLIKS